MMCYKRNGALQKIKMRISTLQHKIDRNLALHRLNSGFLRQWFHGPLRGIAEIYIPYRLYKVVLDDRRIQSVRYYAVDAASGTLDPYEFATAPGPHEWTEVAAANYHPVRLAEDETKKLAIEKVRRMFFSHGFFRLANPCLIAELINPEFYLPYWVGFYGEEQNVDLKVLNAVRETMEGSKVPNLLKTWLLEQPAEVPSPAMHVWPSADNRKL